MSTPPRLPGLGQPLTRRDLARSGVRLGAAAAVAALPGSAACSQDRAADWPAWAQTRDELFARLDALRREAADIREFGARMDGVTDESAALERALASGARAIAIPGEPGMVLRLTRPIALDRAIAILGAGEGARILCDGAFDAAFVAAPPSGAATDFVRDIRFDQIRATRAPGHPIGGVLVSAFSVRGLYVTRCRTERMSLAVVRHMRQRLKLYGRDKGSKTVDPAVVAGFSATRTDDLSEDIYVLDNRVDYGKYQGAVLRVEFGRKVVVSGNTGNHAKVSWWGGGARISEGGALEFLRRVRDVYAADNVLNGANGGVYGNNGQNIVVARNTVRDMTDVGIDFEGCFDCQAYDNDVRNVGNFCYVTFYAARNIEFRDNYGEQDGSGGDLWLRFGKGKYGASKGVFLAALRSANFSQVRDAITVSFRNNRFRWTGKQGFGACAPSFFESLSVVDNVFEDVLCDWRYRLTRSLEIRGNTLRFSRPFDQETTLVAGSASAGALIDNTIELAAPPRAQAFVGYSVVTSRIDLEIAGLRLTGRGAEGVTLAIDSARPTRGKVVLRGNRAPRISLDPKLPAAALQLAGNIGPAGATLSPTMQDRALPANR